MRAVLALLPLVFFACAARADWRKHPESLVVKVYSCFSKNSEDCLEGSGILVRVPQYSGHVDFLGVLTSEHVVLPSNEGVYHRVVDAKGRSSEAFYFESNWEGGVALMSVGHEGAFTKDRKKDFPLLSEIPFPDLKTKKSLIALGFPAGSHSLVRSAKGENLGVFNQGVILGDWSVIETRGLSTEFGMSGGPVFTEDGELYGIMSHVNFDADPKTYLVPIQSAVAWGTQPWPGEFYRTVDDWKRQFFSRSKAEKIHLRHVEMTVEKRGGQFIVTLPTPPPSGTFDTMTGEQMDYAYQLAKFENTRLGRVRDQMASFEQEVVAFSHRRDGGDLSSMTMVEFLRTYMSLQFPVDIPFEVLKKAPHQLQPWEEPE